jgi:parallel beta-helix repeat protein
MTHFRTVCKDNLNQNCIRGVAAVAALAFCLSALAQAGTVDIHPGQNITTIVAQNPGGTTFIIYPGTYRLTAHIVPKTGDKFIGQTACAPPKNTCPAILSGSKVIGGLAKFNGVNYEVTNQTQQGLVSYGTNVCEPGFLACNRPEDLFFDGVPYQHLYAGSLPAIGAKQWWFDYTNNIIYFHDNPSGHTVETSVVDAAFDSQANNVTIQYLTIKDFASPLQLAAIEPDTWNASTTAGLNWVVENCDVFNSHALGVKTNYTTKVYNSYIHSNGMLGLGGGTDSMSNSGIVVQGNTISNNNYAHVMPDWGSGGVKFGYTAGVIVRGNTISNNGGTGLHFDTSSASPLIDGNVITGNYGGAGIAYEISLNSATVRNNIVLKNGLPGNIPISTALVGSYASTGVNAYCNVIEIPNTGSYAGAANGATIVGSNRGSNQYPPYQYLTSTKNSFHHNTVFWDAGATGLIGYVLNDAAHQPNFFSNNTPPDYNSYHLPSLSAANFTYDNNSSQQNKRKTFTEYQAGGADIHGSADTKYNSGYPLVAITSPVDQSSFTTSVTVKANASDKSGINRVEFYVDWKLATTVSGPPYQFTWGSSASTGTHIVAAMAHSNAGINSCFAVTLTKK